MVPYLVNLGKIAGVPVSVSAGGYYTACVMSTGLIVSFGKNAHNRTGHPESDESVNIPQIVPGIKDVAKVRDLCNAYRSHVEIGT